jgi:AmiR/NasT family two-component response regulator
MTARLTSLRSPVAVGRGVSRGCAFASSSLVRILSCPALRAVLEPHGAEIVGEASDGGTCVERVVDAQRDLALLDLSMPRVHGLTALPELRRRYTGTPRWSS